MTTPSIHALRTEIEAMLEAPVSIGDDDNLIDIGLDSMRAMTLAMRWEEEGIPLDFADLAAAPTIRELAAILDERRR